jgi:hypothetical protein
VNEQNTTEQQRRQRADLVNAFSRRAWQPSERPQLGLRLLAGGAALVVVAGGVFAVGALTSYDHKTAADERTRMAAMARTSKASPTPTAMVPTSPTVSTPPPTPSARPKRTPTAGKSGKPDISAEAASHRRARSSSSNELPSAGGPPWRGLVLHAPYVLRSGKTVRTNRIALTMRSCGDLVLRDKSGKVVWSTRTHGSGVYTEFQGDGNLVVYASQRRALWAAGSVGHDGSTLVLQGDANLVIIDRNGSPVWATGTNK